jgi:hypothetical protein
LTVAGAAKKPHYRGLHLDSGEFLPIYQGMSTFDYQASAELYPSRSRARGRHPMKYRRFATAAEAIRFAVEELPEPLLLGAVLEVAEQRFDQAGIRSLYDRPDFPLPRRTLAAAE